MGTSPSDVSPCVFCQTPLSPGPPWSPGRGFRLAFDPFKGRLWAVCSGCSRWSLTPLEDRWESLEACEEAVRSRGEVRLSTLNLTLVDLGDGELIRVDKAPRPEFVDWRYGTRGQEGEAGPGFWTRILSSLPPPPVDGYDPYGHVLSGPPSGSWLASPFLESAGALTYLFSQVPLAQECPACHRPLALKPWDFQGIQMAQRGSSFLVRVFCGMCSTLVELGLEEARATLRLGLSATTPLPSLRQQAGGAAQELEGQGGAGGFLTALSSSGTLLGELDPLGRTALLISLDEIAEAEALEAEWRVAEEMAA
ncbi:hypothetical protein ACFL5A_03730, partial [Gemmatimonadota bacterium]